MVLQVRSVQKLEKAHSVDVYVYVDLRVFVFVQNYTWDLLVVVHVYRDFLLGNTNL